MPNWGFNGSRADRDIEPHRKAASQAMKNPRITLMPVAGEVDEGGVLFIYFVKLFRFLT
jgi:hypothetical protein